MFRGVARRRQRAGMFSASASTRARAIEVEGIPKMAFRRKTRSTGVGLGTVVSRHSVKLACTFSSRHFAAVRRIAAKDDESAASVIRQLVEEALLSRGEIRARRNLI